ncbi:MAG: hypothetical protein AAB092_03715, partial [Chloroflexota bacterium]
MQKTVHLEGHIPCVRARSDPYFYLPFEVPVGAQRIHVAYSWSEPGSMPRGPGNTLDIGVFDPRGQEVAAARV